jgi:hypothetical protein
MSEDREATPDEQMTAVEQEGPRPIMITITNQEIGAMTAGGASPTLYMQFVMEKLKAAGAPVEGILELKLAHGRLARTRPDPARPEAGFGWVWLPDEWAAALMKYQRWTRGEI